MKFKIVTFVLLSMLGGCAHRPDSETQRILRQRAAALAAIDEKQCQASGGTITGVGSISYPVCLVPYPDGGKACTDSSQCTGHCQAVGIARGAKASGICQTSKYDKFGCYSEILHGVAQDRLCVD